MKVLVVGKWSKELAVARGLARTPGVKIFNYASGKNPGMVDIVEEIRIGNEDNIKGIIAYAQEINADMAYVGTETALVAGAVDSLKEAGIPTIGPTSFHARLEGDKAFTRNLVNKNNLKCNPSYYVCHNMNEVKDAVNLLGEDIVVKPAGLTEGVGVKVMGEHLSSISDALSYCRDIIDQKVGNIPRVIIEEKLVGEEFTFQALVGGGDLLPFPLVKDFKRLREGDKGPNTGSMGSYSDRNGLLSFVDGETRNEALKIMSRTIQLIDEMAGSHFCGFLYGQFMITSRGLRLIEYNVRPGDPEILNIMKLLKGELYPLFKAMLEGNLSQEANKVKFLTQATVCKFLVPQGYPFDPIDPFYMKIDEKGLLKKGINIDYSCTIAEKEKGLYHPGPRAVALTAAGNTVIDAYEKVEEAINTHIEGTNLIYRKDIGSQQQLKEIEKNISKFIIPGGQDEDNKRNIS